VGKASAAVAALLLFLAACGSGSDTGESETSAGATDAVSTTTPTTADPNTIANTFEIGAGRELYVECRGMGTPTVLLEAGDESGIEDWHQVMPELSNTTRTCAYDRAGTGHSVDATGCRQLDDILNDLEALLQVADIAPPYVLVGASGGGFLMAGLAARRPADVAGLVLVETPKAITTVPPDVAEVIRCDAPRNVEHRDYVAVEHAVWDNRGPLGTFPMTIMSNDWGRYAPSEDDETNVEDQLGWLVLSPNSKQVVVTSGHDVPNNEPDLVISEILAVLDAARSS